MCALTPAAHRRTSASCADCARHAQQTKSVSRAGPQGRAPCGRDLLYQREAGHWPIAEVKDSRHHPVARLHGNSASYTTTSSYTRGIRAPRGCGARKVGHDSERSQQKRSACEVRRTSAARAYSRARVQMIQTAVRWARTVGLLPSAGDSGQPKRRGNKSGPRLLPIERVERQPDRIRYPSPRGHDELPRATETARACRSMPVAPSGTRSCTALFPERLRVLYSGSQGVWHAWTNCQKGRLTGPPRYHDIF